MLLCPTEARVSRENWSPALAETFGTLFRKGRWGDLWYYHAMVPRKMIVWNDKFEPLGVRKSLQTGVFEWMCEAVLGCSPRTF